MARMSNKRRLEWSFFLNDRSRITYNELCRKCQHECKQGFRAVVVDCPKYLSMIFVRRNFMAWLRKPMRSLQSQVSCQACPMIYSSIAGEVRKYSR